MLRALLLFLPLVVLNGCTLFADESYDLAIRTDAASYVATDSVAVYVVNRDSETLYVRCTPRVYLLEFDGSRVDHAWIVGGQQICVDWDALAPGDTVSVNFRPEQAESLLRPEKPRFDGADRYRVEIEVYRGRYEKELIPDDQRRSNRFRVRR